MTPEGWYQTGLASGTMDLHVHVKWTTQKAFESEKTIGSFSTVNKLICKDSQDSGFATALRGTLLIQFFGPLRT